MERIDLDRSREPFERYRPIGVTDRDGHDRPVRSDHQAHVYTEDADDA